MTPDYKICVQMVVTQMFSIILSIRNARLGGIWNRISRHNSFILCDQYTVLYSHQKTKFQQLVNVYPHGLVFVTIMTQIKDTENQLTLKPLLILKASLSCQTSACIVTFLVHNHTLISACPSANNPNEQHRIAETGLYSRVRRLCGTESLQNEVRR